MNCMTHDAPLPGPSAQLPNVSIVASANLADGVMLPDPARTAKGQASQAMGTRLAARPGGLHRDGCGLPQYCPSGPSSRPHQSEFRSGADKIVTACCSATRTVALP